jgi:hypothetical protein
MVFAVQESSGHMNPFVANVVIQLAIAAMFALFTGIPTVIAARRRKTRQRNHETEPVFDEAAYRDAARTPIGSPEALRIGRQFAVWLFGFAALVMAVIGLAGLDADAEPAMKWVGFGLAAVFVLCLVLMVRALRRFAPRKPASPVPDRPRTGFRTCGIVWVVVGILLTLIGGLMLLMNATIADELTTGELAWGYLLGVAPFALGMLCFVSAEQAFSLTHIRDVAQLSARRSTLAFGAQAAVVAAALVAAAVLHDVLTDIVSDDWVAYLVVVGICSVLWLISAGTLLAVRTAVRALAEALPAVPASGVPGVRQN